MKYNHMLDVAFSLVSEHEDWVDVPTSEIIPALRKRLEFLEANPEEAIEAFGHCDTYEVEDE